MGTRADFYVKKEWLGSIALDGYPSGIYSPILTSKTEPHFREAVSLFLKTRKDATFPKDGWPWPWENSTITDWAYVFDGRKVKKYSFGCLNGKGRKVKFPDMTAIQNVDFGERSGLIVFPSAPKTGRE